MERYCKNQVLQDLERKMAFIAGPRQVGKTTLSKSIMQDFTNARYFNWDIDEDRKTLLNKRWSNSDQLIIFDELHKYTRWKQWIKGVYDSKPVNQEYIVTGSARLDTYKKGGDSLLGRYHFWRLHPLTIDELPKHFSPQEGYERLLTFGGFPEPFLLGDVREARRWRKERFTRILQEDVRDLKMIHDLKLLGIFIELLRARVGGLVVIANLAQDLEITHKTAKEWLNLTESLYIGFAIYPFINDIPRSIKKPPKVYFYDNADIYDNEGARLENLIATTLLKRLNFIEDYYGYTCSLHYIRDKDLREVDFITVIDGKIEELIEVKLNDLKISSSLKYYADKLQPKRAVQIVGKLNTGQGFTQGNITVINPIDYFTKEVSAPWEK